MAATTETTEKQVSLKLMVNKETNKVLFAEAKKDFVDILCSILTLPLGTIARLVQEESNIGPITLGCLNALYHSVENPHTEFLSSVTCKEMLLKPRKSCYCSTLKLNIDDTEPTKYFTCVNLGSCRFTSLSTSSVSICSCGGAVLSRPVFLNDFRKGFVCDAVTYIITDDLVVMPNSMDTSLGFLLNFGVKSISSINEMIVNVTKAKVLDLLKYSLLSKTTLTNLFLRKKPLLLEMSNFSPYGAENSSSFQINVKLAIRKSDDKVMYAQGEKDFADLLLCFLTFPLAGVVRILGGNCSVGCIDGLCWSIADLDETYFVSKEVKNRLVDPRLAPHPKLTKKILPIHEPNDLGYYCHYQNGYLKESVDNDDFFITDYKGNSGNFARMYFPLSTQSRLEGFVKGPAVYMATDDLVVTPMSPFSAIHLLGNIKADLSDIKEKVVSIGVKECLSILKASLSSTAALTNGLSHLLTQAKEEK